MKQQSDGKQNLRQKQNMQFLEDRTDLLDTIREMIDCELDRREQAKKHGIHPENPPPIPPPRWCSLWQRIMNIFTVCLL